MPGGKRERVPSSPLMKKKKKDISLLELSFSVYSKGRGKEGESQRPTSILFK